VVGAHDLEEPAHAKEAAEEQDVPPLKAERRKQTARATEAAEAGVEQVAAGRERLARALCRRREGKRVGRTCPV